MLEIGLICLLILVVGGVAYWLWGKAPFIPEPFKAIGSWIILVVAVIMFIIQIVKLIKLL